MERIPVMIDTDPGVDDFFCLCMCCANPQIFDLKAVTTIGGNNTTDVTTQNALNILHLLGREVPVGRGADSYLQEPFGRPESAFHGSNGLAEQVLPKSPREIHELPACDLIYQTACDNEGRLVIVTVGPETNLALSLRKYPDLKEKIKKIIVMGGSTTTGNITPMAEANIWHDAYAAKVVFESGIPIDMIGLNVTRQCTLSPEEFDDMSVNTRPDLRRIMRNMISFRRDDVLHDAIAISSGIDDKIFEWEECRIKIHTEDEEHKGLTTLEKGQCHRAAIGVDRDRYLAAFARMAEYYR